MKASDTPPVYCRARIQAEGSSPNRNPRKQRIPKTRQTPTYKDLTLHRHDLNWKSGHRAPFIASEIWGLLGFEFGRLRNLSKFSGMDFANMYNTVGVLHLDCLCLSTFIPTKPLPKQI